MNPYLVRLATDGACSGNPGPGGWGALLEVDTPRGLKTKELCGGDPATTNNRMELTAVLEGFRAIRTPSVVEVLADSQYVIKAFADHWIEKWQSNGWRTAKRVAVENQDLWAALLEAVAPHQVTWTWVKGHAGHPLNERADQLARQGQPPAVPPSSAPEEVPDDRTAILRLLDDPAKRLLLVNYLHTHPDAWSAILPLMKQGG